MPLTQSPSETALRENIAAEIRAGKDPKQAAAIGYSVQRANSDCVPVGPTTDEMNEANRKKWSLE